MAKDERGTKRQCEHCGMKYYDLNRDPILCPGCGEPYVEPAEPTPRKAKAKEVAPVEEAVVTTEVETDPAAKEAGAEVVSFEDADNDQSDDNEEDTVSDIPDVEGVANIGGEVDNSFVDDADEDGSSVDYGVNTSKDED